MLTRKSVAETMMRWMNGEVRIEFVKIEQYCALEGLIILLILMFEVAVLCRRVPATCQALVPTSHLSSHLPVT